MSDIGAVGRDAVVRVFLARPLDGEALEAGFRRFLDDAERARAACYRHAADRARFVTGRVLARGLVARETGVDPASLGFVLSEAGKPALRMGGGVQFNIAHSGDLVALALALAPFAVGVDVERIDPSRDVMRLAATICTPAERHALARHADPAGVFFRYWAAKEAVLKADGLGLRRAPDGFSVDLSTERWAAVMPVSPPSGLSGVHVRGFDAGRDHAAAVAIMAGEARLEIERIDAGHLAIAR